MSAESEKIQKALDSGYSVSEIQSWYLGKGLELPAELRQSAAKEAGAKAPFAVKAAMTAMQGPTFGFADELMGGVTAPFIQMRQPNLPLSKAYEVGRDVYRGGVQSLKEEYPIGSMIPEVAGAMALGGPVRQIMPNVGPMTSSAITGGTYGAISGAGGAESMAQVPQEATTGGIMSAVLGPATQVVSNVLGPVAKVVGGRASSVLPQKVQDYMGMSSADLARRRVAQAMMRDGATPEQVAARMGKLGDDAVIAEAAGTQTRDLLDTMATLPGRTKNFTEQLIRERQAGRAGRLTDAAGKQLSPDGVRLADTVEDLIKTRSTQATPFYDKLRPMVLDVDADLVSILQASDKLGAFKNAKMIATAERVPFSLESTKGLEKAPWTDLDMVKRGLDDLSQSARAVNSKGEYTDFGRAVLKLKTDLVNKVDNLTIDDAGSSIYKQARAAYAGPSSMINSAEMGRTILSKDASVIKDSVKDMTESEFKAFQVGAFEALRTKLGKQSGQTEIMKMWREPATQEKLKEIFPNERAYREFATTVAAESRKQGIESVGRGSATAGREARMEDVGIETLKDIGAIGAAAKTMNLDSLIGMIQTGMSRSVVPEPVRNEIGNILLSRAQSPEQLKMLKNVISKMEEEQKNKSLRSGLIGGNIGGQFAEPVTQGLRSLLD
jgi:hypothetical protein